MLYIFRFFVMIVWIFGLILAKGFWSTFFAIIIPPWAWYLVVEYAVKYFGLI